MIAGTVINQVKQEKTRNCSGNPINVYKITHGELSLLYLPSAAV